VRESHFCTLINSLGLFEERPERLGDPVKAQAAVFLGERFLATQGRFLPGWGWLSA